MKNKIWIVFFVMMIVFFGCKTIDGTPGSNSLNSQNVNNSLANDAATLTKIGINLCSEDNYLAAIDLFNKAIKADSNYSSAYTNRGYAYIMLGKTAEAMQDLDLAITIDKKNTQAYFFRARLNLHFENHKATIDDCSTAIKIFENDSKNQIDKYFLKLYELRADAYYMQKEYEKAVNDFSAVIYLDAIFRQNPLEHYKKRAIAYTDLGDYENAIKDHTMTLSLDKTDPLVYCRLGDVNFQAEKYNEAIEAFNSAIKLKPFFPEAYAGRGYAFLKIKELNNCVYDFNKAIELKQNYTVAYAGRGWSFLFLHDYEKALVDFNMAIKLDSKNSEFYNGRGIAYYFLKRYSEALIDFDLSLKLNPDDKSTKMRRDEAYKQMMENEK